MTKAALICALAALAALAACSKGETYDSRGEVDSAHDSTTGRGIPNIDVGMKTDTVNVPTVGMKKDTIIVDKPVITGRKPVEVKRPTMDVNRKP
ncbi:MAG TPA: hypothetical protein VKH19_14895 [Gemmatimonadaceae bacterium]|nr:hypothetical protein [Gemmatimonadaceae bacterium]